MLTYTRALLHSAMTIQSSALLVHLRLNNMSCLLMLAQTLLHICNMYFPLNEFFLGTWIIGNYKKTLFFALTTSLLHICNLTPNSAAVKRSVLYGHMFGKVATPLFVTRRPGI